MANKGICKVEACDKPVVGKGYCKPCYRRWKRGEMPKPRHKKVKPPKAGDEAGEAEAAAADAEAASAESTEAPAAETETPAEG